MKPLPLQLDWLHPGQRRRGWQWLGAGILCLGLAAAGLEVSALLEANAGIASAQDSLQHLRSRSALARASVGSEAAGQGEAAAEGALQRLALPWNRLLLELEAARGEDVALLSLETDAAKGSVRLMGEAKSLADVLAYVERLGGTVSLATPQLLSQENRQSDGQPVVAFVIEARWNNR